MCINSVYCPLCCQMTFSNIDTLRIRLIKAANGPLTCPICKDILLGLDKLTIHLFSHTNIMTTIDDGLNNICNKNKNNNFNNDDHEMITAITNKENNQKENFIKITNNTNNNDSSNHNNNDDHDHDDDDEVCGNNDHTIVINSFKDQNSSFLLASSLSPSLLGIRQVTDNNCKILNSQYENEQSQQQIKCDICELIISSNDLLKVHRKLIHKISDIQINNNSNSKNIDSNNCSISNSNSNNSSSSSSSTLCNTINNPNNNTSNNGKDHFRFQCHLCSKIFKMKGSLRVHLKVVHAINNDHLGLNIFEKLRKKNENDPITDMKDITLIPSSSVMTTTATTVQTGINTTDSNNFNKIQEDHQQIQIIHHNDHQKYEIKPITISIPNDDIMNNCNPSNYNENIHSKFIENFIKTNSSKIIALKFNNNGNISSSSSTSNDSTSKIWECDVCSKSFTTKYFLKKHKRLHTGEMPYTCELCGKTFTFQQSYHKHLLYHSDEKPHSCTTCGRAFKELSTLHNHERIHSGEKPFKCENCGKCFRQRVSYLVHKRIHTGVMPYKCSVCDKSFRYKVSQRTHKCIGAIQQSTLDGTVISIADSSMNSLQTTSATVTTVGTSTATTDLLQGLLQAASIIPSDDTEESDHLIENNHKNVIITKNDNNNNNNNNNNDCNNKCASNELNDDDNDLAKSIDDIVAEQCDKMGIKMNSDPIEHKDDKNNRISSPSEKLQNLCLYSPITNQSAFMTIGMEPINEDSFKQFLFNVDENW